MKKFASYCVLSFLILSVVIFLPFLKKDEIGSSFLDVFSLFGSRQSMVEHSGLDYWLYFLPLYLVFVINFFLGFARTLSAALVGFSLAIAGLVYVVKLDDVISLEISEMYEFMEGYDYMLALAVMFTFLVASHTYQLWVNPKSRSAKRKKNSDLLDDIS